MYIWIFYDMRVCFVDLQVWVQYILYQCNICRVSYRNNHRLFMWLQCNTGPVSLKRDKPDLLCQRNADADI
jgi:hypothetical protein